MASTDVLYVALLMGATPVLLASLYLVLGNMNRDGARPLVVLLGGALVWILGALAAHLAPTYELALLANRAKYVGIVAVPFGLLLFALFYVDRDDLVNAYSVGLLLVEPIVAVALVWTSGRHGLWWTATVPEGAQYPTGEGMAVCREVICYDATGQGFLVHTVYSYVLLLVGATLVISRPIRSDAVPRGQAVSMAVAVLVPLVGNVLSIFVLPEGFPDLTPVMFGVTGVALVVGLYRYSLVETGVLTGAADVEGREDGAVLVDDRDEVVDVNVTAAKVLGVDADTVLGGDIDDAFADQDDLRAQHDDDPSGATGLDVADPIAGDEYRVDVTEIDPDETPQSAWLYEFTPTD